LKNNAAVEIAQILSTDNELTAPPKK
jgi:hypothetical protein